ncbi:MAG: aldo/keto reductase [Candidatus Omnitrophota bacterium]
MEKRKLGKTSLEVAVLGFGGAEVGLENTSLPEVERLLGSALDAGLNVIDTAECYGTSEESIGRAVAHRREDFFLFTKCGHSRGFENPADWADPVRLQNSLEQSLKRLRTGHLDLFQLHSCSRKVLEKGVVIDFIKKAKRSGKTRFIGYSGENDAALYAVRTGVFDTLQMSINLADQHSIDSILPVAVKQGMGVIAKRPIANVAWRHKRRPIEYHAPYWERFKKLDYDFLKAPEDEAVATALRFVLSVPGVSVAIVGTQHPGRWQENACIVSKGPLDPGRYEAIRRRWKEIAPPDWLGQV